MKFSSKDALKCYRHGDYIPTWRRYEMEHPSIGTDIPTRAKSNFDLYSPAYPTTNENWRIAMSVLQPINKSVLTVAGSGAQPFAFAISGAKHIDTFDISFFAKAIMEMKTSAIRTINHPQYINFVYGLSKAKSAHDIPYFNEIKQLCPPETITAIKQMSGCKIFNHELVHAKYLPTESEYNLAKQKIHNNVDFIWTDLQDLSGHLEKNYDIIYLSNIFEYFYHQKSKITEILNNLKPFVKANGQIMLYTSWLFADTATAIKCAAAECEWGTVKTHQRKNLSMLILTRTY